MSDSSEPDPLAFPPVPGRARHDGWTPERQRCFVAALAAGGTISAAARAVGMSAKSAYALRRRAGEASGFAQAWDIALARARYALLEQALPLAINGEVVPVFYGGRQIGQYRRYDTRLALAILQSQARRGGVPGSVGGR
jgi:hypothetical protein